MNNEIGKQRGARVQLTAGSVGVGAQLLVDGEDWSGMTEDAEVQVVSGDLTRARMTVIVSQAGVDFGAAEVTINGHYVSDEVAREFYEDLKTYFGE